MKKYTAITVLLLCAALAGCADQGAAETGTPASEVTSAVGSEMSDSTGAVSNAEETELYQEPVTELPTVNIREPDIAVGMDNWQDYFELRVTADPRDDEEGNVAEWNFCYGVFLKPEYIDHFSSAEVNFEVIYDTEVREFVSDDTSGSCQFGKAVKSSAAREGVSKTFALEDFRNDADVSVHSGFYQSVAGRITCGSVLESGEAVLPVNGQVQHAEGTLHLIP